VTLEAAFAAILAEWGELGAHDLMRELLGQDSRMKMQARVMELAAAVRETAERRKAE
jgi:hypothetical protein